MQLKYPKYLKYGILGIAGTLLLSNVIAAPLAQYGLNKEIEWDKQQRLEYPKLKLPNCDKQCADDNNTWRVQRAFDKTFDYSSFGRELAGTFLFFTTPSREIVYKLNGL